MRKKIYKQASRKQPHSMRWLMGWEWIVGGVLLTLVLGFLVAIYDYFSDANNLPIQHVKVEGTMPHLDPLILRQIIDHYVQVGFLRLKVKDLQEVLSQDPWVSSVFIGRLWPDTVVVRLEEHVPLARWRWDSLLSIKGVVFTPPPSTLPEGLPRLNGPVGTEEKVLNLYKTIEMLLTPLSLKIQELELTTRGAWTLTLEDQTVIQLGGQDVVDRLKRFITVYHKIVHSHHDDVDTVDLRYPNGVAVRWKNETRTGSL